LHTALSIAFRWHCVENSPADTEVVPSVSPEIADMFNEPENNEDQESSKTDPPPTAEQ